MGKQNEKAEAPKKERRVLTPAERVAKLERELAEAREKAAAKAKVQIDKLLEKRTGLVVRRNEVSEKIRQIDAELDSLGYTSPSETEAPANDETVAL